MNSADVLSILLERLVAAGGGAAVFSAVELAHWPAPAVAKLKADGLLVASTPAASVICPGCEEDCAKPVETASTASGAWRAFVACDKRDDTARVPIPAALLEQWQCTPAQLAAQLAKFLGLRRPLSDDDPKRLDLGMLKGTQGSAHVVLHVEGALSLYVAGHVLPLTDVVDWTEKGLTVERRALVRSVDSPIAAAGRAESAAQRKARIQSRAKELKALGVDAFIKALVAEEGISESRIKQLLKQEKPPATTWHGLPMPTRGATPKPKKTQR
jgi:hypothetical protein